MTKVADEIDPRGLHPSSYAETLKNLAGRMAGPAFSFSHPLKGKLVVLAVRPEDADDYGQGVLEALQETGATVRIACLWTDKDYKTSEDAPARYIVRTEYVEHLPNRPDAVVLAVPVVPEFDLIRAMWKAIEGRCKGAEVTVLCGISTKFVRNRLKDIGASGLPQSSRLHFGLLLNRPGDVEPLFRDRRMDDEKSSVPNLVQQLFEAAMEARRTLHP